MSRTRWTLALALTVLLLVAGCSGAAPQSVTVLGAWTGAEGTAFSSVIKDFERQTGIRVYYIGTRTADTVLASELSNGDPPDVAALANPGELRQYAAAGSLSSLDGALDQTQMNTDYTAGVRALTRAAGPGGTEHTYAIVVKAALKSVLWYAPARTPPALRAALTAPGLTWDRLTAALAGVAHPWCLGLADAANSGWPGTDWIEDLLLHQAGPQVYQQWVDQKLPWTDARVQRAWQAYGAIVAGRGGTSDALRTSYQQAGYPMFAAPQGCVLDHEGSFVAGFYPNAPGHPGPGSGFDFVPFPPATTSSGPGAEEISGDLLGVFHDSPAVRRLVNYLASPTAQLHWITRGAGAFTLNRAIDAASYPDPLSRRIGADLQAADTLVFDGSDSMPHAVSAAFTSAVVQYTAAPDRLHELLTTLEHIRLQSAAG